MLPGQLVFRGDCEEAELVVGVVVDDEDLRGAGVQRGDPVALCPALQRLVLQLVAVDHAAPKLPGDVLWG